MAMYTINIIGAGRVGSTLARLFVLNKLATINAVCNQRLASSHKAYRFIGEGTVCTDIKQLPACDITFITTPDEAIADVAGTLACNSSLPKKSLVVHCSGVLSSDVLSPLIPHCLTASIHPMHSFARPSLSVQQFKGTYCAIEGEVGACQLLTHLFEPLGAYCFFIEKNKKALYHAAAVMASNYLITLAELASNNLTETGVEKKMALAVVTQLMQNTLGNLTQCQNTTKALTGPIKRGDINTIKTHLNTLSTNEKLAMLYKLLAKLTIPIAQLDNDKEETLLKLLTT